MSRPAAQGNVLNIRRAGILALLFLVALLPRLYSAQTIGWNWDHSGSFTLINFDEGENVRVITGPFANFQGFVDEVMEDKEKLRVMVQVFGRATPVVLGYSNVEKA